MAFRLRIGPLAEQHIRTASAWWEEHRPAAPELLRSELRRGLDLITTRPGVGAPALDEGFEGVRRLNLSKIRYHLYYRVRDETTVEVLALWHTSRGEDPPLST